MDTVVAVFLLLLLSSTTTMAKKQRCWSTSTANSNSYNYTTTGIFFVFSNCLDLPHLNATLFWTLNSTTTTSTLLSLLFVASPAKPSGWIGWAINPIAPRMLGAQVLLAFRRPHDGSIAAATANINTYFPVLFSKISYVVTDLEAVEKVDEDEFGVAAKLRLPAGTQTVNHVWQVGPDVTADGPIQHYFEDDNLDSVGHLHL